MILHVLEADYVDGFRLRLRFNDGSAGEVDLADALTGPIFEPLRNVAEFRRFQLAGHTVAWSNGADFAPEYLHSLLPIDAAAN